MVLELPETVFVRRKDVMEVYGLSKHDMQCLVEAGLLNPFHARRRKGRPVGHGKYRRSEVVRVLGEG